MTHKRTEKKKGQRAEGKWIKFSTICYMGNTRERRRANTHERNYVNLSGSIALTESSSDSNLKITHERDNGGSMLQIYKESVEAYLHNGTLNGDLLEYKA